MLNNLIGKFKRVVRSGQRNSPTRQVIPRDDHNISRKHISEAALKVIARLHRADFQAYLVGGGVRDLLLGLRPKDFDVATDATPEQVRALFNNARIIGRRFKIVHVRFGREVIEVTTFRGHHQAAAAEPPKGQGRAGRDKQSSRSESGMLLRDNVFGTLEEDALRRDFSVNALYYTSEDFTVHDFANGIDDLDNKIIRIIGKAETRYREDPVRMLRAVRFAAKLDFRIEAGTAAPIKGLASSLRDIPAARMFDEVLKLLMAGIGLATYQLMREYHLFEQLFPDTADCLGNNYPLAETLIHNALENTDQRINQGKPVTPAFIFAALLWPAVQRRAEQLIAEGVPVVPANHQAGQEIASRQQQCTAVPKRFGMPMREIWDLQLRLPRRGGHKAENLMENRRFRAAYDFLLLREQAGEETGELGKWWTEYQNRPEQREAMSKAVGNKGQGRRRSRRNNH